MATEEIGLAMSLRNRREVSSGLKETREELDDVGDAADKAAKKSDRLSGAWGKLKGGAGLLAKGVGIAAGALGAAGLGLAVFGGKAAMSLQTATMNLTTLTGSAKKAKSMVKELTAYGNATTFDTANLTTAAQEMLTYGINAKDVMPNIKLLGDISMGNSEKLGMLSYAFAQVQGAGKLTGQDLLQMINAGFNPLNQMSKRTGKSMGELREAMSKGQISFDDVRQSMVDATKKGAQFYQGAKNGAKTLEGAWGNFTGTIESTLGSAMLPAIQALQKPLGRLADLVGSHQKDISRGVRTTVRFLKRGFSLAEQAIGPVSRGLSKLWGGLRQGKGDLSAFSKTWESLKKFVEPLVPIITSLGRQFVAKLTPGISAIGGIVTTKLLPAFRDFLPAVRPVAKFLLKVLGGAVLGVLSGVIDVVKGVLRVITGLFKVFTGLLTGDWSKAWSGIKDIVGGAIQAVWGAIKVWWNGSIIAFFRKGLVFLTKGIWTKGWTLLKTGATKGMSTIGKSIGTGLKTVGNLILRGVKGYLNMWRRFFTAVWGIVKNGWRVLRSAFGGAVLAIKTVVSQAFNAVKTKVVTTFRSIIGNAKALPGRVVGYLKRITSGVKDTFSNVLGYLKSLPGKISAKTTGMWDGIKDAFRGAINWIIDAWNSLKFSVPKVDMGPLGSFGGFTISVPAIPRRAQGGPVEAGKPYIVGDRGPKRYWELFVPDRSGYIHPKISTSQALNNRGQYDRLPSMPASLGGPAQYQRVPAPDFSRLPAFTLPNGASPIELNLDLDINLDGAPVHSSMVKVAKKRAARK